MNCIVAAVFFALILLDVWVIVNARYFNGQQLEPMVIGGASAKRNQFPFIVSLQLMGQHTCGGSILSPTWVVTAGHCCDDKAFPGQTCSKCMVVAGMLHQGEQHPDIQNVSVAQVVQHPKYYHVKGKVINNDITLLKLFSALKFTFAVKPIRLPSLNQEFEEGWTAGWGIYMRPSLFPVTLQYINMQVINNTVCQKSLARFDQKKRLKLFDTMVCTLPPIGAESLCNHDSGGPLSYNDTLIGIASWAVECYDYHIGAPTVFTAVNKFVDFLQAHVHDLLIQ